MPSSSELENIEHTLRFRTTQAHVDYLTALAILDDTTIGEQARRAIDGYLADAGECGELIEQRKLIRTAEMPVRFATAVALGSLATDRLASVDQMLHEAFGKYIHDRLDDPELPSKAAGALEQEVLPV
ncbi:MAG TPA: hypothetical protein VFL85_04140 [Candidatus Saccharimonadales bacterium]|nr:hypothetical protein [Candidatus Saccharimonadales bacterium]